MSYKHEMKMNPPIRDIDVSVIIVNFNTLELTRQCIQSIVNHTQGISYEIIVIDNNSNDGSQAILSSDPRIYFIKSRENLGFGKANNLGIHNAAGKYLLFLNSDTYLKNNAIYEFWKFNEENKKMKIGACGCILYGEDMSRRHSYAKLMTTKRVLSFYAISPFSKSYARKLMGMDVEDENKDFIDVGYVTGADIFVQKKVIHDCGAFDPDFFMYSEECEMQWRFRKKGYRNIIIKTPKIVHLEGMSQKNKEYPSMNKIIMIQSSLFLYVKKTSSYLKYISLRLFFPFTRIHFLLFAKRPISEKMKYLQFLLS